MSEPNKQGLSFQTLVGLLLVGFVLYRSFGGGIAIGIGSGWEATIKSEVSAATKSLALKDAATKSAGATALAAVYKTNGKLATEGKFATYDELAEKTSKEGQTALGLNDYLEWTPVRDQIAASLTKVVGDNKIKSVADYGKAFDAIAEGLLEGGNAK